MKWLLLLLGIIALSSCVHRQIAPGPPPAQWTEGNQIKTLINGKKFYPPMLGAIHSAKKSITFETFAYVDSPIASQFTKALAAKAAEGVKVNIILDQVGSKQLSAEHLTFLRKAGAKVLLYRPFQWWRLLYSNNRTHRKILIIDGQTAFTGGAGIAHSWVNEWRDTQYSIQGPAVAQLQRSFAENWLELNQDQLVGDSYFPKLSKKGPYQAQFISDTISNRTNPLAQGVLHAITSAQQTLLLEQSYFVPNARLRQALLAAARRGVKIEIILPGKKVDSPVTRYASQNHWRSYLEAGIRLYQYEAVMMHGKLLIADGSVSIIGSGNIDDRSFFLNDEVNLHVRSKQFAREQEKMFRDDLKSCREITLSNLSQVMAPWFKRFFSGLIAPQL